MDAARQMGFEFKERTQSGVKLDMLGELVAYEVLNVMEYSSDRCGTAQEAAFQCGWCRWQWWCDQQVAGSCVPSRSPSSCLHVPLASRAGAA